eukprot:4090094-Pyramimonas_sp.AAC.1
MWHAVRFRVARARAQSNARAERPYESRKPNGETKVLHSFAGGPNAEQFDAAHCTVQGCSCARARAINCACSCHLKLEGSMVTTNCFTHVLEASSQKHAL